MIENFSPLINELINAFICLPSVGQKSARRMAFYLLQHEREAGKKLAEALSKSMNDIKQCIHCRFLSEEIECRLCLSHLRHKDLLCIVESPSDLMAIEHTGHFNGVYFVLMGHLSPIDGIGPQELGLDLLEKRFQVGEVKEIILATNSTVEGQSTAYYIAQMAEVYKIKVTKIAQGIPLGGELEYIDSYTLAHAFKQRQEI